jgi:Leucine-rich repeat (LRR) protein
VTEIGIADARIEEGLEVLLEWALCRGGRRLRIKRDACGHCDLTKLRKTNTTASLEILELEHLQLEDISGLADLLAPHSTTLRRLSLRGNARICDAGIVSLAKAFVRTASALEVLDLRNTGCSDGGAVALARALKARRDAGFPAVAVDVGENLLSARGANDLMKECEVLDLRRNDLEGARLSLKNAPHLRQVSLASCAFTPLDGEDFLKTAAKSRLEVLDLSGNALTTVEACVEINQSVRLS